MGELEAVMDALFGALSSKDVGTFEEVLASDVQGVDEISRKWLRGSDEVGGYAAQLMKMVDEVSTQWTDVKETIWGDVGLLTCWIEQDYVLEGTKQHVSAPTSIVCRRENGAWKLAGFHSIPLSEEV